MHAIFESWFVFSNLKGFVLGIYIYIFKEGKLNAIQVDEGLGILT